MDEGEVIVSDDGSCMFYAEELYWMNGNGTGSGNYSLDLEKSSCKPVSLTNANATTAMYV